MKMEEKTNVRFNVTIDLGLLLSYEQDKLTLENTSNGTFQKSEGRDENKDNENLLFQGNKSAGVKLSKGHQNSTSEISFTVKKLSTNVVNQEVLPNVSERREDIKGKKEPSADEDINDLFHHLYISDSDNEYDDSSEENESNEKNKDPSLRERTPTREKQLKNKRQAPYVSQTHHKPVNLCLLDLDGDNSESNPFNILDYFSNTSEEAERNIAVSPEPSTNQSYDHITTSGDDNIHKQNKEVHSDYGITDSCLEGCGTSSASSTENDYETFFPLHFDNYVSGSNEKAFKNYVDGLLSQLPDCDSTTCKFSDNGKTIPKYLELTKNDCETKTAYILENNKIRKNELSNLKTQYANTAKTPPASKLLEYIITDSCLEKCGTSSLSSPENDYETFFPLDFDNFVSGSNDKAFLNSTICKFSDNGKTIPKCLKVTKNDGETKTAHILENNKIRKNGSSNLKTPDASIAKPPLASAPLENIARERLKAFLWDVKYEAAKEKILRNINNQREFKRKEDVEVIYIEDEGDKTSEKRTNLHNAVLNSELEEIYCLVEMYVKYSNHSHTALNLRDRHDKTAIDYAIQNNMALVVEYLMEKNGQPYARIKS